eukprot:TRINITY_DN34535_c0_g1_i1.p1 TRINITY_DN34535_c0_g1~~TRINITY_DN34535_c0_g1_i1.p1  ORF type:complete len:382 (+),score=99.01 TRINITY_DN34535_c0_g1_i1:107-1252(+)
MPRLFSLAQEFLYAELSADDCGPAAGCSRLSAAEASAFLATPPQSKRPGSHVLPANPEQLPADRSGHTSRHKATSFKEDDDPFKLLKTPVLRKRPRIKFLSQSPEIYETDIGKWEKGYGSKWACDYWVANKEVGNKPKGGEHPFITFQGDHEFVNVELRDETTGKIYWYAKYQLPGVKTPITKLLSRSKLTSTLRPIDIHDPSYVPFRKPCVAPDDPQVHHFDLRVWTQDGMYDDDRTPWGDAEGWEKFGGPDIHAGFDVVRMPILLKNDTKYTMYEKVARWRSPKDSIARPGLPGSEVVQDAAERLRRGQDDMYFDDKTMDNGRGYYEYIYDLAARKRDNMKYLWRYAGPSYYDWPEQTLAMAKAGYPLNWSSGKEFLRA